MAERVALIDYGAGNLQSVRNALKAAGAADIAVTADPEVVAHAERIVLPGVGAFAHCMEGVSGIDGMIAAFESTPGHLSQRLMAALEAGQQAGGDTRGMQSAAILIVGKGQGVWLNNDVVMRLQVDDSPQPIAELRRLVTSWNERRAKGQQRAVTPPRP